MIYIQTNTVTVEFIKVTTESSESYYYVGNEKILDIPLEILAKSFISTNWNRAIKYSTQLDNLNYETHKQMFYYQLHFDVYFDEKKSKILLMAKNNFDSFVVEQEKFQTEVIKIIIQNYNQKNSYENDDFTFELSKDFFSSKFVSLFENLPKNIDNFIVSEKFDLDNWKYRWKSLIKFSDHDEIFINKNSQIVYFIDKKKINFDNKFQLIDPNKKTLWLQGYTFVQNQQKLNLKFFYQSNYLVSELQKNIFNQLNSEIEQSSCKNLHKFNLTKNIEFLHEMFQGWEQLNYQQIKSNLDDAFTKIHQSYYDVIFNDKYLLVFLFNKIDDFDDFSDFRQNYKKFSKYDKNWEEKLSNWKNEK